MIELKLKNLLKKHKKWLESNWVNQPNSWLESWDKNNLIESKSWNLIFNQPNVKWWNLKREKKTN
jgi:hypothetical protein